MVKHEIDFDVVNDTYRTLPSLEAIKIASADAVRTETERLLNVIESIDERRSDASLLTRFADNSNLDDYVVWFQTMTNLLDRFSLLEFYYDPRIDKRIVSIAEYLGGWELSINRLDSRGTFRIVFEEDSKPGNTDKPIGRHTLYYKRAT